MIWVMDFLIFLSAASELQAGKKIIVNFVCGLVSQYVTTPSGCIQKEIS